MRLTQRAAIVLLVIACLTAASAAPAATGSDDTCDIPFGAAQVLKIDATLLGGNYVLKPDALNVGHALRELGLMRMLQTVDRVGASAQDQVYHDSFLISDAGMHVICATPPWARVGNFGHDNWKPVMPPLHGGVHKVIDHGKLMIVVTAQEGDTGAMLDAMVEDGSCCTRPVKMSNAFLPVTIIKIFAYTTGRNPMVCATTTATVPVTITFDDALLGTTATLMTKPVFRHRAWLAKNTPYIVVVGSS